MIIQTNNLLNGASKTMNVDGSGTPKVFSYSPGGSVSVELVGLTCVMQDEGTTSLNKFGALTALTNGVLIQVTINSVTTTITTIKDNADLCTRFHGNHFGNSATLSLLGIVTPEGFGNSTNIFMGHAEFNENGRILLTGADSISVTVQDNLTGLNSFQISCKVVSD